MARGFVVGNSEQAFLLPPSIDDWVEKGHVVRFIWDCLKIIDLSKIYDAYSHEGKPPFSPIRMLGILIYAYSKGVRSSRMIAKACKEELPFRWIAGNITPNHSALCRFRVKHKDNFRDIFLQVLRLCAQSKALNIDRLFLDGTKMKAFAALEANRTLDKIRNEIDQILEQAEAVDREEDARFGKNGTGDQLPPELADPRQRLARLREAKQRLEAEQAAEQGEKPLPPKDSSPPTASDDSDQDAPPPPPPEPKGNKAKANITDPDSRIVKTRRGFIQGFNAQIVVTGGQFVVANHVTQDGNDVNQLEPMLAEALDNLKQAGIESSPKSFVADAGYWKEALPVEKIEEDGPELFVATRKDWKQRKELRERGAPRGRPPKGLSRREHMERKLLTKRGFGIYRRRGQTVEAPFGHIKTAMGADGFLMRGLDKVRGEWDLICTVFNLKKLFQMGLPLPA